LIIFGWMTEAFVSAGAAAPDEFYDAYTMDVGRRSLWSRALRRFVRHRVAAASVVVLAVVFAAGFLASWIAPYGYQELDIRALGAGPSWAHPFGTDQFGRDYFSRVLFGIGTEAEVALVVAFFGTVFGTVIGGLAGYYGGAVDNVIMRASDLMLTLPPLITLLVAVSFLHLTTLFKLSLLFGAVLWMPLARIVRGTAFSIREKEYVDAARAVGASDARIIVRHVLPNAVSSVAVAATVMTAAAIVLETTISYLGFGLATATRTGKSGSLGDVMFVAGSEGLFHWWGIVFPGAAVVVIIVPIYFIGDGIRDALDPTERRVVKPPRRHGVRRVAVRTVRRAVALIPGHTRAAVAASRIASGAHSRVLGGVEAARSVERTAAAVVGDAFDGLCRRSRRRRRGAARLLREAAVIAIVTAGAAVAIYIWKVNPVHSDWPARGVNVVDVSRAPGAQTQVSITAVPDHPGSLLAASNDTVERSVRVYSSSDGGRTWASRPGPPLPGNACAHGEPSVAATPDGREHVAFIVSGYCSDEDVAPYLVVASRPGAGSSWIVARVAARPGSELFDAMPSLAAAADGRVYVAWDRRLTEAFATTVVSSSRDGGRTWSAPEIVSRRLEQPHLAASTVGPDGTLYVAGVDVRLGVWVARSSGAGRRFVVRRAGPLRTEIWNNPSTCARAQNFPTAFEAVRCLGPNPSLAATHERLFVTYSTFETNASYGVIVATFDPHLRLISRTRAGPPEQRVADQFWPSSATDVRSGRIWACYYDTSGDPSRKKAWFSCTTSRDGVRWTTPVRAADDWANVDALWQDARLYEFGDLIGYGGYTSVTVDHGSAHPMWIDTRDLNGNKQEIFGATLRPIR
jgi:ABC-type dipeptide/oligopeptide/nickel transport system permease subunit